MFKKSSPPVVKGKSSPGATLTNNALPSSSVRPSSVGGQRTATTTQSTSTSKIPSSRPSTATGKGARKPTTTSSPQDSHPAPVLTSESPDLDLLCKDLSLAYQQRDQALFNTKLAEIRSAILFYGIPADHNSSTSSNTSLKGSLPLGLTLRGRVWQLMLGVGPLSSSMYVSLINLGRSEKYMKIRGDSFRTFPQDQQFQARVKEEEIVRVLNAFVHQYSKPNTQSNTGTLSTPSRFTFTYCQGMNTICAPMLYCMPELSAYAAFCLFITEKTPLYWLSSHIGVEAGCKLVDRCLSVLDPQLSAHLQSHHLASYLYAFHCVSSFSASVPPFSELLQVWDFLLSFGPHLNILIVTAQIIALRKELLETDNPKNILDYRKWPKMRARMMIAMAMSFITMIDESLYDEIRKHAWHEQTAEAITGRKVEMAHKDH